MIYLLFIFLTFLLFIIRKTFSKWFLSPSGLLLIVWITIVMLQMILAPDFYFIPVTCFLFLALLFSFFLGDSFAAFKNLKKRSRALNLDGYYTPNFRRNLSLFIIFLGFLSIIGAILYTNVFIGYFGSLSGLLTAGWAVRGVLESVPVPLPIRAILMLGYSCVILAVVYFVIYGRIRWFLFLPFISLLILGIVQAGRAGFIMILVQIFIGSFWKIVFDNTKSFNETGRSPVKFPEKKLLFNSVKLLVVVMIVFVGGNMLRTQNFSTQSDTVGEGLESFKVYLFGGVSAFSTFIDNYKFGHTYTYGYGKYSFSSLFDLLGIAKNELGVYTTYLRVSSADPKLDTNIFTAFRQYIDDFGIIGAIFFMMIFGYIAGSFFNRAIKGNIEAIAVSIGIYTILFHTILLSITVHNGVLISLILPTVVLKICKIKIK